jgi:hypothetical protein
VRRSAEKQQMPQKRKTLSPKRSQQNFVVASENGFANIFRFCDSFLLFVCCSFSVQSIFYNLIQTISIETIK